MGRYLLRPTDQKKSFLLSGLNSVNKSNECEVFERENRIPGARFVECRRTQRKTQKGKDHQKKKIEDFTKIR